MVACRALALAWLAVALPFLCLHGGGVRPFFNPRARAMQDFPQYYMGGRMAWMGAFDALYPEPASNGTRNVGYPGSSTMRPVYAAEAAKRGLEDELRFVHPPPAALLFGPLGGLPYRQARAAWVVLLGLCLWGTAVMAGRLARSVAREAPWIEILTMAIIAFSPLALKSARTANITPWVTLFLGLLVVGMVERRNGCAAAGLVGAGLLKGISAVLIPLLLLLGRWRTLAWAAVLTLAINAIAVGVMGGDPYVRFFADVAPSLGRSDPYIENQSLQGLVLRLTGRDAMPAHWSRGFRAAMIVVLAGVFLLAWRRRDPLRSGDRPDLLLAALGAMTAAAMLFAPFAWGHYYLYTSLFWGWMLAGPAASGAVRWIGRAGIALVWLPWGTSRWGQQIGSPWFQSHMVWGLVLMLAFCVACLVRPTAARAGASP